MQGMGVTCDQVRNGRGGLDVGQACRQLSRAVSSKGRSGVLRVFAEVMPDGLAWQAAAAFGWLVAFLPWVARIGGIYLSPRLDGKPG